MKIPQSKGFTLVELLVSIGIFSVITTISIFSYSDFNSNIMLTNLAYEIALSVRQAQFYGISVKQSSLSNNFDSGYGVHFDSKSPTSYTLFEDRDVNHIYYSGDANGQSEALETYQIQKGNFISKLCTKGNSGSVNICYDSMDLSFIRPNPDTFVAKFKGGTLQGSVYDRNTAIICVASPKNTYREITVESTGQISVSTDAVSDCSN